MLRRQRAPEDITVRLRLSRKRLDMLGIPRWELFPGRLRATKHPVRSTWWDRLRLIKLIQHQGRTMGCKQFLLTAVSPLLVRALNSNDPHDGQEICELQTKQKCCGKHIHSLWITAIQPRPKRSSTLCMVAHRI
jgi:hypothetical protein